MSSPVYSSDYYRQILGDSEMSAIRVVPLVVELFSPGSVVDVGCGPGAWAKAYRDAGVRKVLGIDGEHVELKQLLIPPKNFQRQNLAERLTAPDRFDLVNCLEVAEHLPEARAETFVADLCRLSDVVIFSAAIPGQGGTHHLNERWPSYWIEFFRKNGFEPLDCFRPRLWNEPDVAWWYVQNMFAFVAKPRLANFPKATAAARPDWPTDVVHPRAYVRATVPKEMSPRMIKEVFRALPHFPKKILKHWRG